MYMVLFVLNNPDLLDEIPDAWEAIGVSGITIVESTGVNRRRLARQVGSTFMAGINRLMSGAQEGYYTAVALRYERFHPLFWRKSGGYLSGWLGPKSLRSSSAERRRLSCSSLGRWRRNPDQLHSALIQR